jgi:hypothetical protein
MGAQNRLGKKLGDRDDFDLRNLFRLGNVYRIGHYELGERRPAQPLRRGTGQHGVHAACLDLPYAELFKRADHLAYGSPGGDLIVENERAFAPDLADDVMNLGRLRIVRAAFVKNSERQPQRSLM